MIYSIEKDKERFWSKIDIRGEDECHLWKASIRGYGYGQFWYKGSMYISSRIAWIFTYGDIPEGMSVLHTCDNTLCNNVKHLYLGTQADNILDRTHRNPNNQGGRSRTISDNDKATAVKLRQTGMIQSDIAYILGISRQAVGKILQETYNDLRRPRTESN